MRISPETIYRWVALDSQHGGELHRHLRRGHKHQRRQKRYGAGRRFIPGRVGIEQRPAIVNERSRFGDWEGDLVVGSHNSGAIATHVERKSRFLKTSLLENRKAETFNTADHPRLPAVAGVVAPDVDAGQRQRIFTFQGAGK